MKPIFLLTLSLLTAGHVVATEASARRKTTEKRSRFFKFMTYNLYQGFDFRVITEPDTTSPACIADQTSGLCLAVKVKTAFDDVVDADFPSRAKKIASIIANKKPVAIGLQEVVTLATTDGSVSLDYLSILLDALEEEGLQYEVTARLEKGDPFTLPFFDGELHYAQYMFTDVLLVEKRFDTRNAQQGLYADSVVIAGLPSLRGFVASEIELKPDVWVQVVSTHLESQAAGGDSAPNGQAEELATMFPADDDSMPTIAMGDFNNLPGDVAYQILANAGYQDTWLVHNNNVESDDGFTCCQNQYLTNQVTEFDKRIDYILASTGDFDIIRSKVIGNKLDNKTGKWNSDHAGVLTVVNMREVGA